MKAFKVFGLIVSLLITVPLWYALIYKMLQMIHATDGMWLMFWIYAPSGILVTVIFKVCEMIAAVQDKPTKAAR